MFLNTPEFIWNRIFDVLQVILAGGLVAWFVSHYFNKKDEVTRVKGVLLEKRLSTYELMMDLISSLYRKKEIEVSENDQILLNELFKIEILFYEEIFIIFEDKVKFFQKVKLLEKQLRINSIYLDPEVEKLFNLLIDYLNNIENIINWAEQLEFKNEHKLSMKELNKKQNRFINLLAIIIKKDIIFFYVKIEETITNKLYNLKLETKINPIKASFISACSKLKEKILILIITLLEKLGISQKNIFLQKLNNILLPSELSNRILIKDKDLIIILFHNIMLDEYLDDKIISNLNENEFENLINKVLVNMKGDESF